MEHHIRQLGPADVEAGLRLSAEAGWNQTADDWRFMIGFGRAIGADEPGRGLVASALVLPLGLRLSWLSMVLVARDRRRLGLGTTLLRRCIAAVQATRATPGLDATEQGRPVYGPLGFRDLYPISRWVLEVEATSAGHSRSRGCCTPSPLAGEGVQQGRTKGSAMAEGVIPHPSTLRDAAFSRKGRREAPNVHPTSEADLPAIVAYDEPCSAIQRAPILRDLQARAPGHIAEADGRLVGYALGRPGRNAAQIGPVVAEEAGTALALINAALAPGGRFILDVPDAQGEVARFLQERGAARERGYMRMTLGPAPELSEPGRVFALAGPELA